MVTRILTAAACLCIASLAAAQPGTGVRAETGVRSGTEARGKTLFETRCATCHGLDARGGQALGIGRGSPAAAYTDDRLRDIIRNGKPGGMPGVGASFPAADVIALVQHLRQLQRAGDESTIAIAGDPDAGRALFFGKAACAECHSAEGRGGFLGSDLSRTRLQADAIRQAILHPEASTKNSLTTLTLRDGSTLAGVVRNEDNFSIQLQDARGAFHSIDKTSIATTSRDTHPLMPADYGQRLSDAEIQNLVRYITQLTARR
jgi:cytochrome c oxidase cbb3-type subunit III